jgi:hypothetical protein
MHKILTLLGFIFLSLSSNAQNGTKAISFSGNPFMLSIPAIMDTMPADKILIKYNKKPDAKSAYYANADFSFAIVVDEIANNITEDMLEPLKPQLLTQLGKQKFTENRMLTFSNHKIWVLSYNTEVPGSKIFNRRIYFVAGKKLFSVAYNTTETDLQKRKVEIESSIRSVKIK